MQKHKIKLTSDDDEVRSQKSHYTNVSKISSKHVELSLEVEMDDEVREIIKSPEKCSSALLDVTVIKPKGLDKYTTEKQTLKTDQVKKMIASMNLNTTEKKMLMEKLFGENAYVKPEKEKIRKKDKAIYVSTEEGKRKSCLSSKNKPKFRESLMKLEQGDVYCVTDETNSAVYSMYKQTSPPKDSFNKQQQQIYTSPRTYENIRTMFTCKNKDKQHDENEKIEPCLCQNCAIVGILTDSQKKPFATEPIPEPTAIREPKYRSPTRRKSVSFKHLEDLPSTSKSHEQCEAVFKLLNSRINELEKRVAKQEEKAVPKDYFKKIITKLVNHLSKLTNYATEDKTMSSSYKHQSPTSYSSKYKPNEKHNRYYVNPLLVENTYKLPAEKEYDPKPCSSTEPPKSPNDSIWKWGEEFLTSGRDLKNKVVILLEETLHSLKKGWEKPETDDRFNEDMQSVVNELSRNLAQTMKSTSPKNKFSEVGTQKSGKKIISDVSEAKTTVIPLRTMDKRSTKPSLIPRFMRKKGPVVNVAYVNPQLKKWTEESTVSFKIDSSDDYDVHKETMSEMKKKQYKKEFLKVLANTKTADKFKLWQNIWNQALENRQTKKDIVTIQIPDPKDLIRQKMIHLEYTIGDLEKLLTTTRTKEDKKK